MENGYVNRMSFKVHSWVWWDEKDEKMWNKMMKIVDVNEINKTNYFCIETEGEKANNTEKICNPQSEETFSAALWWERGGLVGKGVLSTAVGLVGGGWRRRLKVECKRRRKHDDSNTSWWKTKVLDG
jgi:hypothetical protein